MEIVYALVVSMLMSGEIKATLYQAPDWETCLQSVKAFSKTETPPGVRDARMTCVASKLDPLKGSKPA